MEDTSKYPDINKIIDHLFRNEAGKMVVVLTRMQTTYTWKAIDDHTTKMTLQNKGNPTGFSKLLAPFVATMMHKANTKDLINIKKIIERM